MIIICLCTVIKYSCMIRIIYTQLHVTKNFYPIEWFDLVYLKKYHQPLLGNLKLNLIHLKMFDYNHNYIFNIQLQFFLNHTVSQLYDFKYSYLIQIICTQFYGFKYSNQIQIISTQFYGFKYSYLIQIICTQL